MIINREKYIGPVLSACETTGELVPTGHRMRESELAAIVGGRSFRCRSCGEIHSWTTQTAHLGYPHHPLSVAV
jgi:hypothetical protein